MSGRLRAIIGAFEQKVTGSTRSSVIEKPNSLQVPRDQSANDSGSDQDHTPTKPELEYVQKPESSDNVPEPEHERLSRRDTAKNIGAENGTLKRNVSKKRLSPRRSRGKEATRESNDEETLSESSGEDDEEIIFNAIQNQDYEALVDFLSVDEIDANELTSEGRRYLHECVVYDDEDACDIVLDAGGHINARDVHGWTALHYAAAFGLTDMTQYLLDRGADPRKKTKEGKTAEDVTEDQDIVQKLQVARARRGLRSISTVSTSDIEAAQEEYRRRTEERGGRRITVERGECSGVVDS